MPEDEMNKYCQYVVRTMDEAYENGTLAQNYFKDVSFLSCV